jgi:hypothetical protein
MPLANINSLWLKGTGYDITIGEDARGDPYISIAINRLGSHMKLQEIDNSWRGKIIKIIGAGHVRERHSTMLISEILHEPDEIRR